MAMDLHARLSLAASIVIIGDTQDPLRQALNQVERKHTLPDRLS